MSLAVAMAVAVALAIVVATAIAIAMAMALALAIALDRPEGRDAHPRLTVAVAVAIPVAIGLPLTRACRLRLAGTVALTKAAATTLTLAVAPVAVALTLAAAGSAISDLGLDALLRGLAVAAAVTKRRGDADPRPADCDQQRDPANQLAALRGRSRSLDCGAVPESPKGPWQTPLRFLPIQASAIMPPGFSAIFSFAARRGRMS